MNCWSCRHGEPYPAPSRPKPTTEQISAAISNVYSPFAWTLVSSSLASWSCYENSVQCRRFPAFVERRKTEVCGEYEAEPFQPVEAQPQGEQL